MKHKTQILLLLTLWFAISCTTISNAQLPSYPIDKTVYTTIERTIVPVPVPSTSPKLFPYELSKYKQYGYGAWTYGPGNPYTKMLHIMPATYQPSKTVTAAKLLNFFAITDIHLTDKESPVQGIYFGYKGGVIGAYSGIILYTTHVLDAAIQTVNALNKKNKFDFGISLGDNCNNAQYNELRWFIDVMDGKQINPCSGAPKDPIPGPLNDYQDKYKAAGLDKSIPWYQAIGNHDHFCMGIYPPDDYLKKTVIGDSLVKFGNIMDPNMINERTYYTGVLDGSTVYGDVIGEGPVEKVSPIKIVPDPDRRFLLKKEWMKEFFNSSSSPKGHGFTMENAEKGFGCYTFEPNPEVPVRVIVLDDTQLNEDTSRDIHGHCSLDKERYEWMVKELDKGQAENKLMIIASHIPIGINDPSPELGWDVNAPVSEKEVLSKLHEHPNLVLWIAGHRHRNIITAQKSPDDKRPELGFWEVETSSLREYPQQFRTFQIVVNSDNTVSVFTADVDPAVKPGSFAETSRMYAIGAFEIFKVKPIASPNVELIKQLSPEMQIKLKKFIKPVK